MVEIFYLPIQPFLIFPFLALLPAGLFGFFYYRRSRRRIGGRLPLLIAALVWAAYAAYEWRMHAWSETVIAPIRVDLLLVVPILYGVTIAGLWACVWRR